MLLSFSLDRECKFDSYLLSVFEGIIPLSSGLNYFCPEVSCDSFCCSFEDNMHFFPSLAAFTVKNFFLWVSCPVFLCVYAGGVCSASRICGLISFIGFGKFLVLQIFSNIISVYPLSSPCSTPNVCGLLPSQDVSVCPTLFSLFSVVLSLCALG